MFKVTPKEMGEMLYKHLTELRSKGVIKSPDDARKAIREFFDKQKSG